MILIALLALPLLAQLLAQAETVHGGDSVFLSPGIGIAWGVLRAPTEEETVVVTRISNPMARYAYLRAEGVNPFTGRRTAVVEGVPLGARADVKSPRAGFADFPRREFHLFATEAEWRARKPALTVYYLGVPDTTPEFTSQAALDAYLAGTQPPAR
ncbi:MAG TPA: hypothetical protein VGV06_07240 [Methylomirabilota bacterium]|nr:hypothetical protein [Methylomirabilota bacterium]